MESMRRVVSAMRRDGGEAEPTRVEPPHSGPSPDIRRLQDLREALTEAAAPPVYQPVRPEESVAVAQAIAPFLSGGHLREVAWSRDLAGLEGERREPILHVLARLWALRRSGASVTAGLRQVQALLAGHCLALLESQAVQDRRAGLALAAASEFSVSGPAADPLRQAIDARLQDSEPAVVRAAMAVVVRRALEVPGPVLRITLETSCTAEPAPLRVDSRPAALRELQAWLDDLRRFGPWPGALDILAPSGTVDRRLAESLLGFLDAVNADFEARGLQDQVRFLCLVPDSRLDAARDPLLTSWRLFSEAEGSPVSELIRQHGGAAVYRRYLHFAQWSGAETLAEQGVNPMLGGALEPLTVHRLEPGESLAPRTLRTRQASPLFVELLAASGQETVGQATRLCRVSHAGGFPLVACRPEDTQPLKFLVDPGDLEVFDAGRRRFVPFLRNVAWLHRHLQSPDSLWTDLQALLRLYYGVRAERDTEFVRASRMRHEQAAGPPAPTPEPVLHELEARASGIADRLGISPEHRWRVLQLLLEWLLAAHAEEPSCARI